MVYSYDEKSKKVKLVKVPKLLGKDAKLVQDSKVPATFLNNVMKMKLNITSAQSLQQIDYSFKQLSSSSCKKSKSIIVDSFEYHPVRGVREKEILSQTLIDASLGNTRITTIHDDTKSLKGKLGLIALSNGSLELDSKILPAIIIDFIFVDNRFRGSQDIFEIKVSQMLLYYAIQKAIEISQTVGIRYLILRPDGGKENKQLVEFYKSMNFRYMTDKHEWMYLKLT